MTIICHAPCTHQLVGICTRTVTPSIYGGRELNGHGFPMFACESYTPDAKVVKQLAEKSVTEYYQKEVEEMEAWVRSPESQTAPRSVLTAIYLRVGELKKAYTFKTGGDMSSPAEPAEPVMS